jgi:hypothetical protein
MNSEPIPGLKQPYAFPLLCLFHRFRLSAHQYDSVNTLLHVCEKQEYHIFGEQMLMMHGERIGPVPEIEQRVEDLERRVANLEARTDHAAIARMGGRAAAKKRSPAQRRKLAQKAIKARWDAYRKRQGLSVSEAGSKGGKVRAANLSPRRRRAIASLGGAARAKKLSKRQRVNIARLAGQGNGKKTA